MLGVKYWCEKAPQITNSKISEAHIEFQNRIGEKSQGCQLERSRGREKKKDVQQENTEYAAMCVPTKQLKEKLGARTQELNTELL